MQDETYTASAPQSTQEVRGRWELQTLEFSNHGRHTIAWGEFLREGLKVPVVPCDAAAVERLALLLSRDAQVGWIWHTDDLDTFPGLLRSRERFREEARRYLRVVGRTD